MIARSKDSVSGSKLFFLIDEFHFGYQRLDLLGCVSNHDPDVGGNGSGTPQHMLKECLAANPVQNLCVFGFHTGALARGEN
jgi:hypothetical protein